MTYRKWIEDYVATRPVLGMCASVSKQMSAHFPELRVARGWVEVLGHQVEHWWCVAPDGAVVDPTASQYVHGVSEYREFKSGDIVRVGRCMNCGYDIFAKCEHLGGPIPRSVLPHGECCCSDECSAALNEYYNGATDEVLPKTLGEAP